MAFTVFVAKPDSNVGGGRGLWGNQGREYLKVGYSGATVEASEWIDTSDCETLQLTVRGADANNAVQLYGSNTDSAGDPPAASETTFPIGAAITAAANEYVFPVPEQVKIGRTTTNGATVDATLNGYKKTT